MPKVNLLNVKGENIGEIELSDAIFGIEPNEHVVHMVVKAHLANCRQGTQSALTRSEVSGGGCKPWRQKGTGRARQGSTRSPQWKHGGIVFAPKPRDYHMTINKKVKRLAMKSVLSDRAQSGSIIVLDKFELAEAKTKEAAKVLSALNVKNALIVLPAREEVVERSARNIAGIDVTLATTLSAYEILRHKTLILTVDSLKKIEEVHA